MAEEADQMPSGEEAEQAALKIQALQRGKKTREDINEKKEAATKIQALHRGNSVRRTASGNLAEGAEEEGATEGAEELPSGEDVEQAAVKIQALQRGRQARKAKDAQGDGGDAGEGGEGGEEPSAEEEMPSGEDVEQAAVKIQALQRGRQTRKAKAEGGGQGDGGEGGEPAEGEAAGEGEGMPAGEDVEQAAVKIQALQRGRQARKAKTEGGGGEGGDGGAGEGEGGGEAGGEEEMPAGEDVEQAAVKIQALQRGRQARKGGRAGGEGEAEKGAGGGGGGVEEMPSGADVENAAVKIQAMQRGRQTRQEMSNRDIKGGGRGGEGSKPGSKGGRRGSNANAPLERQWTEKQKAAAVRIQAAQRGRQARHILGANDLDAARDIFAARQAMRERHLEASTLARHHSQAEGDVVTLMANKKVLEEAHQYQKKRKDEDELAAIQMQSLYRGFRDRRAVRRVREDAEADGRHAMHQRQLDSANNASKAAEIQRRFQGYSAAASVSYMGQGPNKGGAGSVRGARKAAVAVPSAKKEQAPTLVDTKASMSSDQRQACAVIEEIINKWATSYARAVELQPGAEASGALHFVALFSKPSKEEPIAWPVVRVNFTVPEGFASALVPRVTYSLEGERMVYDVTTDLGRRFKESWLDRIVMDKRAIRADMALRTKR